MGAASGDILWIKSPSIDPAVYVDMLPRSGLNNCSKVLLANPTAVAPVATENCVAAAAWLKGFGLFDNTVPYATAAAATLPDWVEIVLATSAAAFSRLCFSASVNGKGNPAAQLWSPLAQRAVDICRVCG